VNRVCFGRRSVLGCFEIIYRVPKNISGLFSNIYLISDYSLKTVFFKDKSYNMKLFFCGKYNGSINVIILHVP